MFTALRQQYVRWWTQLSRVERWGWISVGVATALGATYRLLWLRETMQFLADQGRDVITAYGILHGDIALVGPSTSVGSMFLGPFYYYFMAPWLALAGNDPIGPSLAVAFIGVLTLPALFWVGKRLVGTVPAALATLMFAVSPVAVEYTRFSWNPNPAPIVMIVLLYATWKAWKGSARWWLGVAIAWAIIIQLHYVALLSLAPAGLFWLADVWRSVRSQQSSRLKDIAVWTAASVAAVLISWVPLVLFDFRFDHQISKGFVDFLNGDPNASSKTLVETLRRVFSEQHGRAMHILFEVWGGRDWTQWFRQLNTALLALFTGAGVLAWWRSRTTSKEAGVVLTLLAVLTSVIGLSWYDGVVFHHYITYILPATYLFTGVVLVELVRRFSVVGMIVSGSIFAYALWLGVQPISMRYLERLGWTVDDYKTTAQIISQTLPEGVSYALTHLSDVRDYRGLSYRYFLLTSDNPPVPLENAGDADYLVIVADNPRQANEVLGSPVYEVVIFPKGEYSTIDIEDGPRLYFIQRERTLVEGQDAVAPEGQ